MRRRITIFSLCLAWLCANGAVAHTAQLFAWSQLIIDFSRRLPAAQAFSEKCDDRHLCPICLAVQQAEDDARNHPLSSENINEQKLVLACQIVPEVVSPQEEKVLLSPSDLSAPLRTEPVRMQPPRNLG